MADFLVSEHNLPSHEDEPSRDGTDVTGLDTIKISAGGGRPVNFYVNLSIRILANRPTLTLTGIGKAVPMVVSISELLHKQGFTEVDRIFTDQIEVAPDPLAPLDGKKHKARLQVTLRRAPSFDVEATKRRAQNEETRSVREAIEKGRLAFQEKMRLSARK